MKTKKRDLKWLRKIVNLGARAKEEHIRPEVIALQEQTVLAALAILDREAGVLLADEVGMGKTFQTLGIIACTLQREPNARILVVTPTPELNEQWFWSSQRFAEHGFYPFKPKAFGVVEHLRDLPARSRSHSVVFAPLSIFVGTRAGEERGFLLSLWASKRHVAPKKMTKIRALIAASELTVAPGKTFLGHTPREIAKLLSAAAFKRSPNEGEGSFRGLDELLADGVEAFASATAVRRALDRAHFHALRALVPTFRLLVVDEAHKLKDPWTVRAQAVTQVLRKNYDKAVFLTATPFQLGLEELRHVFQLFFNARTVPDTFADDVEHLFASVRHYQQAYTRFESQWRYVDEAQAQALTEWYARASAKNAPSLDRLQDDNVRLVAEQIWRLIKLKQDEVEPAFRQWMLRSLKPGKHARRQVALWNIEAEGEAVIPLVLYERLLVEQRRATHDADLGLTDVNISSSYAAAWGGRLVTERSRDAAARGYQDVVRRALHGVQTPHPKIAHTTADVLSAAEAGEKTLVFCERTATIKTLQDSIEKAWMQRQLAAWNQVCPGFSFEEIFGSGHGRDHVRGVSEKVPPRFFRGSDELSIAFCESLTFGLFLQPGQNELPREFWQATGSIIDRANQILAATSVTPSMAARVDFCLAQRCVDQAAAQWFKKHRPKHKPSSQTALEVVLSSVYPRFGFLERQNDERDAALPTWTITRNTFDALLAPRRPGLWVSFRSQLAQFPPEVRGLIVEAVRYFLTRREVPFLVELMQRVGSPQAPSAQLREAIELWWVHESCSWRSKVAELLAYLPCLTQAEQKEVLRDMLRSPRIVQNSLASSSRIARQNSFNAPFYPMVLVGNQAFQQGLDLHRQCRRIIHFDLRWNPTDLEQRIGRIERHGCLAERFAADDPQGKVHVIYALLDRTTDAQLYRSVKIREKWMDFLLGQPPQVSEQDGHTTPSLALPQKLVGDLRIELGPR